MTPQSKPITPLTLWTQHPMSKGGKMAGMWSWGNTSPLENEFCENVCSFENHCYAKRYCKTRPNVNTAYSRNGHLLCTTVLPDTMFWAPPGSHRIQSFGEIINETHAQNIMKMCTLNKNTFFTIWTKRWDLLKNPPSNLQIIASNDMGRNDRIKGYTTFCVSKEEPSDHYIKCEGQCIKCGYCYRGYHGGGLNKEIIIWNPK